LKQALRLKSSNENRTWAFYAHSRLAAQRLTKILFLAALGQLAFSYCRSQTKAIAKAFPSV
jgi:hypothetical protein